LKVIEGYDGPMHVNENEFCDDQDIVDACAYSPEEWQLMLDRHDILALCCHFLPPVRSNLFPYPW
jgi:hypothetical protein